MKEKVIFSLLSLLFLACIGQAVASIQDRPAEPVMDTPETLQAEPVKEAEDEEKVKEEAPGEDDPRFYEPAQPREAAQKEFTITHYCSCAKCCGKSDGITATGTVAEAGRTCAVDPDVIPYGSKVTVYYEDGTMGSYIAEDCGGSIKGDKLDVFCSSHQDALNKGVKTARVCWEEAEDAADCY